MEDRRLPALPVPGVVRLVVRARAGRDGSLAPGYGLIGKSRKRTLLWLDAVALAAAVPAGVAAARGLGAGWPVILIMGVVTGCLGGLMRDVVANEVPLVLRQSELYVTAALAGALVSVAVSAATSAQGLALVACAAATFALRAGSLLFGWRLPVYRSRPPRP